MEIKRKIKTRKPKEALLGNNIKEELERQGMSQQEFADLLKINAGFASRIINKEKCISLPIALNVAQILKKPVEELFYKKPVPPPVVKMRTPIEEPILKQENSSEVQGE